ncbi:MAG: 50S ribosomal protein L10 [Planctomycetes bacterium]|nr:50S ribosomal protein L10 [Planctomycetota bacterium]
MSKVLRKQIVDEVSARLKGVSSCVVVDYHGMSAQQTWEFRAALKEAKVRMSVVKNSTAAVAVKQLGKDPMAKLIAGPTALVFGGDDVTSASRKVVAWHEKSKQKKPTIRGGFLEGKVLTPEEVVALSKMPTRDQLLAQVFGTLNAPATCFVSALAQIMRGFATAVKQYAEQKEKAGGDAPAAPAAAEAPAAAPAAPPAAPPAPPAS